MTSLVLRDLILESLTPSVNAPLVDCNLPNMNFMLASILVLFVEPLPLAQKCISIFATKVAINLNYSIAYVECDGFSCLLLLA